MLTVFRRFVRRDSWLSVARDYCAMFYWGGRTEQSIAEALRNPLKEADSIVNTPAINP